MKSALPALLLALLAALGAAPSGAPPALRWEMHELDANWGIGYAVSLADMNGDGRLDILALNERRLVWFENPEWRPHLMLEDAAPRDNVCIAAEDLDRDRRAEVALGAFWKPADTTGSGSVHWLQRPADAGRWKLTDLEPEPTVHRMRWADVDGNGRRELVMAPLHGRGNRGPDFTGAGARVVVYHPPAHPAVEPWKREIASDSLHVIHNLQPVQWDEDAAEEILLASFEGIHLLDRQPGGDWKQTRLAEGEQSTRPNRGSSEIRDGRLPGGSRLMAAIEPWHGNELVLYLPAAGGAWKRRPLDDSLREGHAVWCADFDGRPGDEIVAGWRGPDRVRGRAGVAIYRSLDSGWQGWERLPVDDGGMACEDIAGGDLDGDGRIDLVASGRSTHNLRIYFNRTGRP